MNYLVKSYFAGDLLIQKTTSFLVRRYFLACERLFFDWGNIEYDGCFFDG